MSDQMFPKVTYCKLHGWQWGYYKKDYIESCAGVGCCASDRVSFLASDESIKKLSEIYKPQQQ